MSTTSFSRSRSPTLSASANAHAARCEARFPHVLLLAFEPDRGDATDVPAARPGVRSDHAIALDFVRELRGTAATEAESALLQDACDACCDDTDVDTLLSVAGGR